MFDIEVSADIDLDLLRVVKKVQLALGAVQNRVFTI